MPTEYSGSYVSKLLTNQSLAYKNEDQMFIHEELSPAIQVIKETDDILSYGTDNLRIANTLRAKGGESFEIETSVSKATAYKLEDHACNTYIDREDYENAEKPINVQLDTTDFLTEFLKVGKEYALASALQTTGNYTNTVTLTGADQWNEYATSSPIDDIRTALLAIKASSGKLANTMTIAWDTYITLLYHPKIKDLFPGTSHITGQMLSDGLTKIFPSIKTLLVGMAQYNNSNKGATLDLEEIWTKSCVISYTQKKPKLKSRSFSHTYQYRKPRFVNFLNMDRGGKDLIDRNSDWIKVNDKYDQVLVDETCGYLIDQAIS